MRVGFSSMIQRPNVKVWNGVQRDTKSKVKYMLVCFFGSMRTVHKEWVPADRLSINSTTQKFLEKLRKRVMRVRPNIAKNWFLHHDNAPAHAALSVAQFLTSKRITVMPQSPYSPDLTPCDFRLFQK
jgi:hypothetical protein